MLKTWASAGSPEYDAETLRRLERHSRSMPSGCREWNGFHTNGYGRIRYRGKLMLAHRLAYRLAGGDAPDHLDVLHSCDNPGCINVGHLFVGTHADNMADKATKGRGTAKLTAPQVTQIDAAIRSGQSCNSLSLKYGVAPHTVTDIRDGVTWRHVTKRPRC